jgi:hypothetical protein
LPGDDGLGKGSQALSNSQNISHKRFESGQPANTTPCFHSITCWGCESTALMCDCESTALCWPKCGVVQALWANCCGSPATAKQTILFNRFAASCGGDLLLPMCVLFESSPSHCPLTALSLPPAVVIVKSHSCHTEGLGSSDLDLDWSDFFFNLVRLPRCLQATASLLLS